MMLRERSRKFQASAPAFIRRESGLLVPDRSFDAYAARRLGFRVAGTAGAVAPFEIHGTIVDQARTSTGAIAFNKTTTLPNVILVCVVHMVTATNPSISVIDITGASLTWTFNVGTNWDGTGTTKNRLELWWTLAPSALAAAAFSVNLSDTTSTGATAKIFGISGCNTTTPIDTHVNNRKVASNATSTPSTVTITGHSTNVVDTISCSFVGNNASTAITQGSGFTALGGVAVHNTSRIAAQYWMPAATLTNSSHVYNAATQSAFWGAFTCAFDKA